MQNDVIERIIQSYDTPSYVFDIEVVKERIKYLQQSLPKNVSLCYAVKANTFIIKEVNPYLNRFEVCSPGEASICRQLAVPMDKMVISGVYKTPSFIEELIKKEEGKGIYTVESVQQLQLIEESAAKCGVKVEVLLRLTSGNQFGLNEDIL